MKSNTGTKNRQVWTVLFVEYICYLKAKIVKIWKNVNLRILKRIKKSKQSSSSDTAAWSSGMILVSGAGGRGFNSRSSPFFVVTKPIGYNQIYNANRKFKWSENRQSNFNWES